MNESVWMYDTELPKFKSLEHDINTDILIIGGGLCGILCAYLLQQEGLDYVLVEGSTIASGITKNTTAKITSQHNLIYNKLINNIGIDKARLYLKLNEKAISEYRLLSKKYDFDFEDKDAYVYTLTDKNKIQKEVEVVNRLGLKADYVQKTDLPFDTVGAIKFPHQAQFNPIKFISSISNNLNIYENTFVKSIDDNTAYTSKGKIHFQKAIVATHFPFINKHGNFFIKMYQQRSYAIAYENAPNINGMYIDEAKDGFSLKNYKDMLIIGGGGHRTGKNGGNWTAIRELKDTYYPNAKEKFHWATQDCMSLDLIPYIGNYSPSTPNLYVASGFNKWGMTTSFVAATLLTDLIKGKENQASELFAPNRSILTPQIIVNAFETVEGFVNPTTKRCPHLGCALKWNSTEHSWDCPCHGSRFSIDGNLIDNPAIKDAKVK